MVDQKAPAAVKAVKTETDPRKIIRRVIVNRLNVDTKNQNLIVTVNDLGAHNGRKSFYPGQEVELSQVHINILKDAAERINLEIPPSSGIYESADPVKAARAQYPGFSVNQNKTSGVVSIERVQPNYSIVDVSNAI